MRDLLAVVHHFVARALHLHTEALQRAQVGAHRASALTAFESITLSSPARRRRRHGRRYPSDSCAGNAVAGEARVMRGSSRLVGRFAPVFRLVLASCGCLQFGAGDGVMRCAITSRSAANVTEGRPAFWAGHDWTFGRVTTRLPPFGHPERAQRACHPERAPIPSERSESRDLHSGIASKASLRRQFHAEDADNSQRARRTTLGVALSERRTQHVHPQPQRFDGQVERSLRSHGAIRLLPVDPGKSGSCR